MFIPFKYIYYYKYNKKNKGCKIKMVTIPNLFVNYKYFVDTEPYPVPLVRDTKRRLGQEIETVLKEIT